MRARWLAWLRLKSSRWGSAAMRAIRILRPAIRGVGRIEALRECCCVRGGGRRAAEVRSDEESAKILRVADGCGCAHTVRGLLARELALLSLRWPRLWTTTSACLAAFLAQRSRRRSHSDENVIPRAGRPRSTRCCVLISKSSRGVAGGLLTPDL